MTKESYFSEEGSAEAVNARMGDDINPRLAEVMSSLVRHLHAFAKEIDLKQDEWDLAIDFLTRTGQICSAERQEFILLSDTLGFSMLVDAINNRRPSGATENTVFGPFHVAEAPIRAMGDNICLDGKGETCLYEGRVVDVDHGGGFVSRYAHLNRIVAKKGQEVVVGDKLGTMGSTGRSTGPHLHYEVLFHGKQYNPVEFIKAGKHVHED